MGQAGHRAGYADRQVRVERALDHGPLLVEVHVSPRRGRSHFAEIDGDVAAAGRLVDPPT